MSDIRVIRYTTSPDAAEENARLIRDVFDELTQTRPEGFTYTAYRLDDGVSFLHVAEITGDENPLMTSPAFAAFQAGIGTRCVDGPTPAQATVVGSY